MPPWRAAARPPTRHPVCTSRAVRAWVRERACACGAASHLSCIRVNLEHRGLDAHRARVVRAASPTRPPRASQQRVRAFQAPVIRPPLAAINNNHIVLPQVCQHVLRRGGADVAEAVGAGRRHGAGGLCGSVSTRVRAQAATQWVHLMQELQCERVGWLPDAHESRARSHCARVTRPAVSMVDGPMRAVSACPPSGGITGFARPMRVRGPGQNLVAK